MKLGTTFSALALGAALLLCPGCRGGFVEFNSDPYLVGDEGNLRFWITEGCGFDDTCSPEVGLPLNSADIGIDPEVIVRPIDPDDILPDLTFSSGRPERFTVRSVQCRDRTSPDRLPCPADPTISYIVTLDLHSEGRADLVARLADDDSLYDRGSVRVRPPD
jgi:hypothetical protein